MYLDKLLNSLIYGMFYLLLVTCRQFLLAADELRGQGLAESVVAGNGLTAAGMTITSLRTEASQISASLRVNRAKPKWEFGLLKKVQGPNPDCS